MRLIPHGELEVLCQQILKTGRIREEWRQRESDDEFQSVNYVGGYDATEDAFTFSRYDDDGAEWWFQLTLDEVRLVAEGTDPEVQVRAAE